MVSGWYNAVFRHISRTRSGQGNILILTRCQQSPACQIAQQMRSQHVVASSSILSYDSGHEIQVSQARKNLFSNSRRFLHQSLVDLQKSRPPGDTSATDVASRSPPKEQLAVEEDEEDASIIPTKDETGNPMSNWARMKFVMKTYGYVVIPVHWVIAPVWFGGFYYAIKLGVDIEPMLSKVGVSEHHIETLKNSRASTALMAYALYKIFTPLRYTLTLGATEFTIRTLRRRGFIKPTPPKEKTYRQSFKDTADAVRDRLQKEKDK